MAGESSDKSRVAGLAKTVAKFAVAWGLFYELVTREVQLNFYVGKGIDAIYRILSGFPSAARYADRAVQDTLEVVLLSFAATLVVASVLGVLGGVARMLARARVRAGQPDFLDRPRAWVAAHPKTTRALLAAPAILWMTWIAWPDAWSRHRLGEWLTDLECGLASLGYAGYCMFAMTRLGLRSFLAPTMGAAQTPTRFEIGPDEIAFDAVAVTRESVATVALFTAIMLAVPTFIWTRPILELFTSASIFYFVGAYIAFAAAGAYAFRKASRVSVGVDGIHVRGTSRPRFFAYRDIDSARANGSDIELVRRGSVVLRLQLHGEDAARREAVLGRISENIARVREGRGAVAAQLVASSSKEALARLAEGAGDYRMATLSREQLWALVEGPEIEASARAAAAEALVRTSDPADRTRLRVAAERCAEPQVRVALEEIAAEDDDVAGAERATRGASRGPFRAPPAHAP